MKAIILSRVSTKEQEEGHSIAAQKDRLLSYCERKELDVIKVFEIVESSTQGNRKEFKELLAFAKKQKETVAIVADAVDRIQRGFKESVMLDELIRQEKIELHFFRENMVIGKDASATDIMRWDFSVMGAKSYVLQLSENVKRSMEYKRKNGEWAGPAPIGYKNITDSVTRKKTVVPDESRAFLIKRLFTEYASGSSSVRILAAKAKEWGLSNNSKQGCYLSKSQIHALLKNPFYCGTMIVKGKEYSHQYVRIIDRELFDLCQTVRLGYSKAPFTYAGKDYLFRGLIRCSVSGKTVQTDVKRKKLSNGGISEHQYLVCRDATNPEKRLYVPEKQIIDEIKGVLFSIHMPEDVLEAISSHLKNSHSAEKEFHHKAKNELKKEDSAISAKLDRLLDVMLDGNVTEEIYNTKSKQLRQRQKEVTELMEMHNNGDEQFHNTLVRLFKLAHNAYELFDGSQNAEKRELLNCLFANLSLNGGKLEWELKAPFNEFVKPASVQEWLRR